MPEITAVHQVGGVNQQTTIVTQGGVTKVADLERIKQAKDKRIQQLKHYAEWERQQQKDAKKSGHRSKILAVPRRGVQFTQNVVLLEAAARDDIDEVRRLLKEGVSPDVANEDGLTALHQMAMLPNKMTLCCIDKSLAMCRLLLQYNANVNACDSEMWTPLHAAATCGHKELCELLIQQKANLLAVNADGNMPYDICDDEITLDYIEHEMSRRGVTQEQIDDIRMAPERTMLEDLKNLYRKRGNLADKDSQGATPLHIAASCGYLEVAMYIADKNISLTDQDKDGWQAIHIAACWGHPDIIEVLVRYGVEMDVKTKNGETIYDICEDGEMNNRLVTMKEELEVLKRMPRNPQLSRKRSAGNSPRSQFVSSSITSIYDSASSLYKERNSMSASIRRSSMREKSMLSRKEARQEALMRGAVTGDLVDTSSSRLPDATPEPVSTSNIRNIRSPEQVRLEPISPSHSATPTPNGHSSSIQVATTPRGPQQPEPAPPTTNPSSSSTVGMTAGPRHTSQRQSAQISNPNPLRASPPLNGHMGAVDNVPLRKFKAPTGEVIGGTEKRSECCCSLL